MTHVVDVLVRNRQGETEWSCSFSHSLSVYADLPALSRDIWQRIVAKRTSGVRASCDRFRGRT
ncbi:MAG: hypothetical protein ACRCUI_09590 [Polymorphobacter sp.]